MRSLIKDVERANILDSILIGRDSILKEKELQISVLDTISKKKSIQVNMLSEKLNQRTDELNLSLINTNELNRKLAKRNKIATWLGFGVVLELLVIIMILK